MEQKNSKKTMSFTRMDRMVLESYKTLCEGLANYLGDGYEIVLHSLENYDNSVIKIINGYYTGRKEGAPITDLALHMLEDIRHNNGKDYIAYYSKNKKGEPMHSTTIAIRSENAKIVGLLCINFYLNTPLASVINTLMKTDDGASVGREENFAEWSEVYSEKGGNYEMTIFYSCDKNRKLEVSVNGTKTVLKDLNSNNEVKSVTIPVSLKQGYNTVQMGNNFGWAPDIDRFTVSRQ